MGVTLDVSSDTTMSVATALDACWGAWYPRDRSRDRSRNRRSGVIEGARAGTGWWLTDSPSRMSPGAPASPNRSSHAISRARASLRPTPERACSASSSGGAQARLQGYLQAIGQADLPVCPSLIARSANAIEGGVHGANWLLGQAAPPTTIVSYGDAVGIGVSTPATGEVGLPPERHGKMLWRASPTSA